MQRIIILDRAYDTRILISQSNKLFPFINNNKLNIILGSKAHFYNMTKMSCLEIYKFTIFDIQQACVPQSLYNNLHLN